MKEVKKKIKIRNNNKGLSDVSATVHEVVKSGPEYPWVLRVHAS